MAATPDFDAVIVGASLAGCTAAIFLARAGARVALVERRPDPAAYKRVCGHYIQGGAAATMERLGLLEAIQAAGGVRSHSRIWTRYGWITTPPESDVPRSVNIRRERLDPMVRAMAAEQPGVELMLGLTARELRHQDDAVCGVELSDKSDNRTTLRAPLVVGADGRDSAVAEMARVAVHTSAHGRFSYAAYYEGPPPEGAPNGTVWFLDPQWAAAFPTDDGLTTYAFMATMDRLPEVKRDLAAGLERFIADLPEAPPIRESKRVSPIIGKVKMPNVRRGPIAPGLALVGDAALATDPLWGVGCGWAFESSEWLAESVAPALRGEEVLERGLKRYRRRYLRRLAGHAALIHDGATGRRHSPFERTLYRAGAHDPRVAEVLARYGTRSAGPETLLAPAMVGRTLGAAARSRFGRPRVGAAA